MASISGRPATPRASSIAMSTVNPTNANATQQQRYVPHIFDLIYAISNVKNIIHVDLPSMYLEAASVDSSRLLGSGASFDASVRALPEGPETLESYTDMGGWAVKSVRKASPRPRHVVYKTARVAFDDHGDPAKGTTSALLSVLTELHSLTFPPLFNHPNIISFLGLAWGTNEFDAQQRLPALVVEYAEHGSLADVLRTQKLTSEFKQALSFDTASGLEAIHAAGLIHGDIKVENVLVCSGTDRMIAKLADFGFSVVEEAEVTQSLIGGTRPWKAPEAERPMPVSQLKFTDVYSLGLMIWVVALDGSNPFSLILSESASIQIEPSEAQVDHLKSSNDLISTSKTSVWFPMYYLHSLIQSPDLLDQIDETTTNTLRQLLQQNDKLALGFMSQWCKDYVEGNPFFSKLDTVFLHTLSVDAQTRNLPQVILTLSEGVEPSPPHVTRTPQKNARKYQVTNNSDSMRTFRMTSARKRDERVITGVPSESRSGQPAEPEYLHSPTQHESTTKKGQRTSRDLRPLSDSAQSQDSEDTEHQPVSAASLRTPGTIPSAVGAKTTLSWGQRGFKRRKFSWQAMRDLPPALQTLVCRYTSDSDRQVQFSKAAFYMNGYGTTVDDGRALALVAVSASAGHPISRCYYYRLIKSCSLNEEEKDSTTQYLVASARVGARAALQDVESEMSHQTSEEIRTWLSNCTGGVGANWYCDPDMLYDLTLGNWRNHEFFMKEARKIEDVNKFHINKRGDMLIHLAAACGLNESLGAYIKQLLPNINCRNSAGDTALLCACRAGQGGNVKLLLQQHEADASIEALNGETPLHWLVSFPDESIAPLTRDLVARGAKIDAVTKGRTSHSVFPGTIDFDFQVSGTPLGWAVHNDRPVIVEVLLRYGADPEYGMNQGWFTSVRWAAHYHYVECLRLMIDSLESRHKISEARMKTAQGIPDDRFAVFYGPILKAAVHAADKFSMILRNGTKYLDRLHATLDFLREKTGLVIPAKGFGDNDQTLFYYAVAEAHDEVVRYMLAKGWHSKDINVACGYARRTPFLEAVRWNRRQMVQVLFENGADSSAKAVNPFITDAVNWSALHILAHEGFNDDVSLVSYLIDIGIPVDGAIEDTLGPELQSVHLNVAETATALNESVPVGFATESPFICALRNNSFRLCDELYRLGADPNALSLSSGLYTSEFPTTTLGHIIMSNARYSRPRMRYLLSLADSGNERKDEPGDSSMITRFICEPRRQLSALHRAAMGCDGIKSTDGNTVERHHFDSQTNQEIMAELLSHFGTPERLNARCAVAERTALHLAVSTLNAGAVTELLKKGADMTMLDKEGETALDIARSIEVTCKEDSTRLERICRELQSHLTQ